MVKTRKNTGLQAGSRSARSFALAVMSRANRPHGWPFKTENTAPGGQSKASDGITQLRLALINMGPDSLLTIDSRTWIRKIAHEGKQKAWLLSHLRANVCVAIL